MNYIVRFSPRALVQLDELENHIATASSPCLGARYVDAIMDYCESLHSFPHRGTPRDDIRTGLRTLGYRRRVIIAFEVADGVVDILGVYYGGRNFEVALQDDDG